MRCYRCYYVGRQSFDLRARWRRKEEERRKGGFSDRKQSVKR